MDVEVLPAGERLVVEGGALVCGAAVQLGVQPQAEVAAAERRRGKRCNGRWLLPSLMGENDCGSFIGVGTGNNEEN